MRPTVNMKNNTIAFHNKIQERDTVIYISFVIYYSERGWP